MNDDKVTIENIVASTTIADKLDLSRIAIVLDGSEYEPDQFPGLIYRLHVPKTAVLIFRSGKVNCTGAKGYWCCKSNNRHNNTETEEGWY
jgi:TATA-box binding protein (TBP), component of TFIID and TFIIIB